ncbi:MAG TPA: hypothetical protein VIM49_01240 [Dermatophilaceae bacterium]
MAMLALSAAAESTWVWAAALALSACLRGGQLLRLGLCGRPTQDSGHD